MTKIETAPERDAPDEAGKRLAVKLSPLQNEDLVIVPLTPESEQVAGVVASELSAELLPSEPEDPAAMSGRTVALVADAITEAAPVAEAVEAARARHARMVVVAAPVADRGCVLNLQSTADVVLCSSIVDPRPAHPPAA